jgi:hypothetical protein
MAGESNSNSGAVDQNMPGDIILPQGENNLVYDNQMLSQTGESYMPTATALNTGDNYGQLTTPSLLPQEVEGNEGDADMARTFTELMAEASMDLLDTEYQLDWNFFDTDSFLDQPSNTFFEPNAFVPTSTNLDPASFDPNTILSDPNYVHQNFGIVPAVPSEQLPEFQPVPLGHFQYQEPLIGANPTFDLPSSQEAATGFIPNQSQSPETSVQPPLDYQVDLQSDLHQQNLAEAEQSNQLEKTVESDAMAKSGRTPLPSSPRKSGKQTRGGKKGNSSVSCFKTFQSLSVCLCLVLGLAFLSLMASCDTGTCTYRPFSQSVCNFLVSLLRPVMRQTFVLGLSRFNVVSFKVEKTIR